MVTKIIPDNDIKPRNIGKKDRKERRKNTWKDKKNSVKISFYRVDYTRILQEFYNSSCDVTHQ